MWLYAFLLWVGMSNCIAEPSHQNRSYHEIPFGATPEISQFMQYTFCYHVYYYDIEEKFPITKGKYGRCLVPTQHFINYPTY